jgi:hypothetical protein
MMRKSAQALVAFSICQAVSGALYAESFLVRNLDDNLQEGSLRWAIESANADLELDTIEFDAGLTGTIVLSSGLPGLNGALEISGPGAEIITISGNSQYRPFSVLSGSNVTLTGLTIANGQTTSLEGGGGIHNAGDLTVTDCVISNNHANFDGGAIHNVDGGSLLVSQSTLSCNTSSEDGVGAGISNKIGTVQIIESTLSGNVGAYYGGAVDNDTGGTLTIERSTLYANQALIGGAVANVGTLYIRNSTLSGNYATGNEATGDGGGGIDNLGEAIVDFSTLTENSALSGGGFKNENTASLTVNYSLVVNSTTGENCFNNGGIFDAQGVNFATDNSCGAGFTVGEINLGPLVDNGGPTKTHALLAESIAIDAALDCKLEDNSPVLVDQRGWARPVNLCDSGAFEGVGSLPAVIFDDGFESSCQ